MALFSECTLQCAQKPLDTADIVRDAIFRQSSVSVYDYSRSHSDNLMKLSPERLIRIGLAVLLVGVTIWAAAQRLQAPSRVWSIGPLTKAEQVMDFAVGSGGTTFTGPHTDSQTGSTYAATRGVVFVGDRLVLASKIGMRQVPDAKIPVQVYQILSLDTQTGQVKDKREITAFGSLPVFATNDAHVIVALTQRAAAGARPEGRKRS